MPKNATSLKTSLFELLQSRGYEPTILDSDGKEVSVAEEGEVFQFHFRKDNVDYGTVTVSVDGLHKLIVYFNNAVAKSPKTGGQGEETWYELLRLLKSFAMRHQLSFELRNLDKLSYDMKRRDHAKRMDESYHAINKKTSMNDAVPAVKIVLQHSRAMEESEQRFRHVEKIFVENENGERFLVPTNKPGLAKVFARHIAEGGSPYDSRGKHIQAVIEEYAKVAGFCRATKNGQFNEGAQQIVGASVAYHDRLRETLHKLTTRRGYSQYFDDSNEIAILGESDYDSSIDDMFECSDERISTALPIIAELAKTAIRKNPAVSELEEWADDLIRETVYPSSRAEFEELASLLGDGSDEVPVGVDGSNATNLLSGILDSDELFARLAKLGETDPDADARETIIDWMREQTDSRIQNALEFIQGDESSDI